MTQGGGATSLGNLSVLRQFMLCDGFRAIFFGSFDASFQSNTHHNKATAESFRDTHDRFTQMTGQPAGMLYSA